MTAHLHNRRLEVVVDVHLRHNRSADVRQVEVAGLRAEARPARRVLPVDRDRRARVPAAQVKHVEADARVRREHRVLARDERHREREQPTSRRRERLEVRRERAVVRDVPDRDHARGGRHALHGRHQLLAVLTKHEVARGTSGARRGRRLVQTERAQGVRERLQPGFLVDREAAVREHEYKGWEAEDGDVLDAVHGAAVEHAEAAAVAGERERHRELALGRHGLADAVDVGRRVGVDREEGDGVGARLQNVSACHAQKLFVRSH